jgi:GH24 family phage-related lysozyme (muramidase)
MYRRQLLKAVSSVGFLMASSGRSQSQDDAFERLLSESIANDALISSSRSYRERQEYESDNFSTKGIAPRHGKAERRISEKAVKLIVGFEVSNRDTYQARYRGVTWPGGKSGITIGIGYDVGYIADVSWLHEDWDGLVGPLQVTELEMACNKTSLEAKLLLPKLKDVEITWDVACQQFLKRCLPLYVQETLLALPNAQKLSDDCLGALVSLVYNRGASFKNIGPRFEQMRAIRLHMVQSEFDMIPDELRKMKEIWQGDSSLKGLIIRRELEARLFEQGLK